MRFIAAILITYISVLTVLPVGCETFTILKQAELCCISNYNKQCSKEQTENKQSDNKKSCTACCSLQNCNNISIPQFNFLVHSSKVSKKAPIKKDKVISNYLSDCWHPPKTV